MLDPLAVHDRYVGDLNSQIQTAYKLSSPELFERRQKILATEGETWRQPYLEFTPQYESTSPLSAVSIDGVSPLLAQLMDSSPRFRNRALFAHQEAALSAASKPGQHVVVATGTGSGKTEAFLLPILSSVLTEATIGWPAADGRLSHGTFSEPIGWRPGRDEARAAAIRAIILYPTNALVNDQMSRLRSYLADDGSMQWQRNTLNGNYIYFGKYTSATWLAGVANKSKVTNALNNLARADDLVDRIRRAAQGPASPAQRRAIRLLSSGRFSRSGTTEMLFRWDMQQRPPDILVTNYSMLGYMLLRPIEADMFANTASWLASNPNHVLTIVLDEAHTYTGARGAEVAYLIMRLRSRLGASDDQIRVIATSATIGSTESQLREARAFVGGLMSVEPNNIAVVQPVLASRPNETPTRSEAATCEAYFDAKQRGDSDAEEVLTKAFGSADPATLFRALQNWGSFGRCQAGANNAVSLTEFMGTLWHELGLEPGRQRAATAGLLALGSLARLDDDSPPLLPTRLHMWFRQLPGLWACINPTCGGGPGPLGKLRTAPDVWCDCGSRVLELFTCRVCGLAFVGGYPDPATEEVWPFPSTDIARDEDLVFFCVEEPTPGEQPIGWVSVSSTLAASDVDGRPVFDFDPMANRRLRATARAHWRPKASSCPRCDARTSASRAAVENHRGKGFGSIAQLSETAFRLQEGRPDSASNSDTQPNNPFFPNHDARPPENPNNMRKLLLFSDGRQLAARLAVELEFGHSRTVFRQLIVEAGLAQQGVPLSMDMLRDRVFELAYKRGIDLSFGEVDHYWTLSGPERRSNASVHFDRMIRREIADREVAIERLGIGRFHLGIEPDKVPPLPGLSPSDTLALLDVVVGILSRQNCVLPSGQDYRKLDHYTEIWERGAVALPNVPPPPNGSFELIRWPVSAQFARPGRQSRLVRALAALGAAAGCGGPALADSLWGYLAQVLRHVVWNTQAFPSAHAVSLDSLALTVSPGAGVHRCQTCGYISVSIFRDVCTRCSRSTASVSPASIPALRVNAYRTSALLPSTSDVDPFPLLAKEHSGQIDTSTGQDYERWFQDLFLEIEVPLERRVDVLSVTTTMEMGIDIGELSSVGLSNIPPAVANYQQRAGRAGRRSDRLATVMALGRTRSHDNYYWDRPQEMLTGQVRTPKLSLESEAMSQRHFYASVLGEFGLALHADGRGGDSLFEVLGRSDDWLSGPEPFIDSLRAVISDNARRFKIIQSGESTFPSHWRSSLPSWLDQLPILIQSALAAAPDHCEVLPELIRRNVLPRFGFPVDLVELNTGGRDWERTEDLQRDLQIAIGEYAPGAEVVVDGKVHRSVGLLDRWEPLPDFSPQQDYAHCRVCHAVTLAPHVPGNTGSGITSCSNCGDSQIRTLPAIRPKGFRTDGNARRYRGGGLDWAGSAGEARLAPGRQAAGFAARLGIALPIASEARTDELYLVNFGPNVQNPGFEICSECGRDVSLDRRGHTRSRCTGTPVQQALLHSFSTDVMVLAIDIPATFSVSMGTRAGLSAWRSLATALLRTASPKMQIDPDELQAGVRMWNPFDARQLGEVFLYDDVPNGAGYVRQIERELPALLRFARELVEGCDCETACYRCLLDYGNQFWHDSLDRFAASHLLNLTINGTAPALTGERVERCLSVIERLIEVPHVRQVDDAGRAGVLAQTAQGEMFLSPVSSLLTMSSGRTSVNGRPMQLRTLGDFMILREPLQVIQTTRA